MSLICLELKKKTFFIKGTCSRLNIEAQRTHRGVASRIKNKNLQQQQQQKQANK